MARSWLEKHTLCHKYRLFGHFLETFWRVLEYNQSKFDAGITSGFSKHK